MKLITTSSKPALLFATGLGLPTMREWVSDIEEGTGRAEEWIKKHPEDPAYVLQIVKHLQGTVHVYEVGA
jgi:hypothetical protein